ncbi:hypothetical protein SAMN05660742_105181 [Propionispira arboris]|uniref:Cof subfamily of IIB subfamily of haloacid dehalogenase superfamily/HAD-superfamily hydrolase, subfamily IIB n=1 Tax=Propionispira arboris TaxID=84035 RepID=A0A1H6XKR1_9FIRM|nr:HAD family hydrolase [Propionispira arboris]SEJ29678.1 hypothetical protein SAMN05660742_105181 [Propionispira arboris]
MKIDGIVFDLDGTLLNSKKEVSEKNKAVLQMLQFRGIKVILATGRNDIYVKGLAGQLGIREPIIACNGASIRNCQSGEVIYHKFLQPKNVQKIAAYCFIHGYDFTVSVYDAMYCTAESQRAEVFHEYNRKVEEKFRIPIRTMVSVADLVRENVLKMFIWQLPKNEATALEAACNTDAELVFVSSEKGGLDIADIATSKGNAVKILAKRYGIELTRMAAFGDHYNDISMLEAVKYSFAMGNASEKVKRAAQSVTRSNDEDGVAWAVEKYLSK